MSKVNYYLIETPDATMTFAGIIRADGPNHVLLCAPGGKPLFRCPAEFVTETTPQATAARIIADRQAALAARN